MTLSQKSVRFEIFSLHDLEPAGGRPPGYREIADRLGLTPIAVRDHLVAARSMLREIVTGEIRQYAAGPDEVREELRILLGAE